jgi:predicted  nucleic acid-binding Zn-ribbon protein
MIQIDLLSSSIALSPPRRIVHPTSWLEHIPFAFYLVSILKPTSIVELGAHTGVSYCGFCQAVDELELVCHCHAVDTWQGDEHAGFYDSSEVLPELRQYHDPLYGKFSRLIQSTFDEALHHFPDKSIDLLHIDGAHSYDAVKHDFETWKPKVSDRGVILFHDINVRERNFGVWKLWSELKENYPNFEFIHGHGLGVLGFGHEQVDSVKNLLESPSQKISKIRDIFAKLGYTWQADLMRQELEGKRESWQVQHQVAQEELERSQSQFQETQEVLEQSISQLHQTQEELQRSQSQLHQTQEELNQSQSQLQETEEVLDQSISQLQETEEVLEQSISQLHQTQEELQRSQSQLHQTQEELNQSQSQLQETEEVLEQSISQLHQTQEELQRSQSQLHQTQEELQRSKAQLYHIQERTNYQKVIAANSDGNIQAQYKLLVWDGWSAYLQGDLVKMSGCLQQSLKYTALSRTETISNWLETFGSFSTHHGETQLDIQALIDSGEWRQLVYRVTKAKLPSMGFISNK